MPAFFHPNQHSTAVAQMIFDDMQDPVQLVYENVDLGEDEEDEDDQADNGPPPLEPQDEDDMPAMAVVLPEEPQFNVAAHLHHGNQHAAVLAHWFTAQQNQLNAQFNHNALFNHQHQQGAAAAVAILNDLNIDLEILQPANPPPVAQDPAPAELNLHALPQMHLYGVLPDDLLTLFHATSSQGSLGHGSTMRMLKTRILSLRTRKPQYWPRIAMGLFKRTARGTTGGCDARILVKPKSSGGPPGIVWGHKFILASNSVFQQLLGYSAVEDCLLDDGRVTDVDIPSITIDAMRTVVMASYDILPPKLNLDLAQYLEYWAAQFCLDDLSQLCQKVMNNAPWR